MSISAPQHHVSDDDSDSDRRGGLVRRGNPLLKVPQPHQTSPPESAQQPIKVSTARRGTDSESSDRSPVVTPARHFGSFTQSIRANHQKIRRPAGPVEDSRSSASPSVVGDENAPPSVSISRQDARRSMGRPRADVDAASSANPVTWSTSLIGDVFSDCGVALEVCLCHPCNVAAQYEASQRKSTLAEMDDGDSSTTPRALPGPSPPPTSSTLRKRRAVNSDGSSSSSDSSSDSSRSSVDSDTKARLERLRAALPPLNVIPCVGVIVLDVMCFGVGTLYFAYWVRREVARRFNIVPDASDVLRRTITGEKAGVAETPRNAPVEMREFRNELSQGLLPVPPPQRENGGDESRTESTERVRRDDEDDDERSGSAESETDQEEHDKDDDAPTSRAAKTLHSIKKTMGPRVELARRAAVRLAQAARKRTATLAGAAGDSIAAHAQTAATHSVDYAQSTCASVLCFPCALCQTHREMERRGLPPVRYLSATRIAAKYATGTLKGSAKRMM